MGTTEKIVKEKIKQAKSLAMLMIYQVDKAMNLKGKEAEAALRSAHVHATDVGVALWRALHPKEDLRK